MYRNTRFGEILEGLSRGSVTRVNRVHKADKFSKGFNFWDHLVAMLFNQLSGCRSLRELETSFNGQQAHHYHLGTREIKRSTLADANRSRSAEPFADLVRELMPTVHRQLRRDLKEILYIIDSTPIPLVGRQYEDWNQQHRTRTFVGLKLHMQMDLNEKLPVYANVTYANCNDVSDALNVPLQENATYIVDKGYCDYSWWHRIDQSNACFITRLKKNAAHKIVCRHSIPDEDHALILDDATMHLTNRHPGGGRKNPYANKPLRQVTVYREDKDTPLVLVTNDFKRTAKEIADLYKARWAIENFFKWIKQNLKIKRFLGSSENAVKIQIYTAIIAYLLLALNRAKQRTVISMYRFVAAVKSSLFSRPETENYQHRRRQKAMKMLSELQPELAF